MLKVSQDQNQGVGEAGLLSGSLRKNLFHSGVGRVYLIAVVGLRSSFPF